MRAALKRLAHPLARAAGAAALLLAATANVYRRHLERGITRDINENLRRGVPPSPAFAMCLMERGWTVGPDGFYRSPGSPQ